MALLESADMLAQPVEIKLTRSRMLGIVLLLVLINLVWAGQPTAVKYIAEDLLGPFAIAFLPFFFITPLLVPLLWWKRNADLPAARPTIADWLQFVIAGVAGQLVAQLGMTWGSVVGQASSCAILYLMIPVLTAFLASLLLQERVTTFRIACLSIGLAGVLLMSAKDLKNISLLQSNYLFGNLLFLVGCVGASFYNVYCKGLMRKFHERDILIYSYITATPASLPFLLWKEPECFRNLTRLDAQAWIAFGFLVLFVYGISMLMFFRILQFLPVTVALTSTYMVPVFGVAIAMFLLGERLDTLTVVGAAVVLAATILIMNFEVAPPADSAENTAEVSELPS
jgi:drug/metabolite transporter (DMT)-like permease